VVQKKLYLLHPQNFLEFRRPKCEPLSCIAPRHKSTFTGSSSTQLGFFIRFFPDRLPDESPNTSADKTFWTMDRWPPNTSEEQSRKRGQLSLDSAVASQKRIDLSETVISKSRHLTYGLAYKSGGSAIYRSAQKCSFSGTMGLSESQKTSKRMEKQFSAPILVCAHSDVPSGSRTSSIGSRIDLRVRTPLKGG
jgi:hypothetical protein